MFFSGCIVSLKHRRDLARFSGRENHFMRRLLPLLVLLLPLFGLMGAAGTSQVTISLTTSVPELLVHGFLMEEGSTQIQASADIADAFNEDGAQFTYAIRTNVAIPLKVTASITPFERKFALAPVPAEVGIEQVLVDGTLISADPVTGAYQIVNQAPTGSGMTTYSYVLTVKANPTQVQNAPAGYYESTVSIGISPEN